MPHGGSGSNPGIYLALLVIGEDRHRDQSEEAFFNLCKAKSRISVLDEGDMRPDQVKLLAKRLGVTERDVIDMNRRLGGDASLSAPIREDGDAGERQDWLVDDSPSRERILVKNEELGNRRQALIQALSSLSHRERRIFEARRLAEDPIPLGALADEFGVSGERVRQIELIAFEKVRKAVQHWVAVIERPERWHHGLNTLSHSAHSAA